MVKRVRVRLNALEGAAVDTRADIYSLAVMAYEILTGKRPEPGQAAGAVFQRALARRPEQRHANVAAFYRDLQHHLTGTSGDLNAETVSQETP